MRFGGSIWNWIGAHFAHSPIHQNVACGTLAQLLAAPTHIIGILLPHDTGSHGGTMVHTHVTAHRTFTQGRASSKPPKAQSQASLGDSLIYTYTERRRRRLSDRLATAHAACRCDRSVRCSRRSAKDREADRVRVHKLPSLIAIVVFDVKAIAKGRVSVG